MLPSDVKMFALLGVVLLCAVVAPVAGWGLLFGRSKNRPYFVMGIAVSPVLGFILSLYCFCSNDTIEEFWLPWVVGGWFAVVLIAVVAYGLSSVLSLSDHRE